MALELLAAAGAAGVRMSSLSRRSFGQVLLGGGAIGRGIQTRSEGVSRVQDAFLWIGQSLAEGSGGGSAISTSSSFQNLMFAGGINKPADVSGYAPMVTSGFREPPTCSFAAQISEWYRRTRPGNPSRDSLSTNFATGAQAYSVLKKGGSGTEYANSIAAIQAAVNNPPAGRTSINVRAVLCVHGEAEPGNGSYADHLRDWQADYDTDIRAITGQANEIPLFMSEMDYAKTGHNWGAWVARPTKNIMACPKYFFTYADSLHLTAASYVTLGEYYAKAYWQHVAEGRQWQPLQPTTLIRDGALITLVYGGRVGDLVFDTTTVAQRPDNNFGFKWTGTGETISSVSITQPSSGVIQITLSAPPSGAGPRLLEYGYVGTSGAGPVTGPRGNVRDSDPMVSRSGAILRNWAINSRHDLP